MWPTVAVWGALQWPPAGFRAPHGGRSNGACRTQGGTVPERVWGLSLELCLEGCRSRPSCQAIEFVDVERVRTCEYHASLVTHVVPREGATCLARAEQRQLQSRTSHRRSCLLGACATYNLSDISLLNNLPVLTNDMSNRNKYQDWHEYVRRVYGREPPYPIDLNTFTWFYWCVSPQGSPLRVMYSHAREGRVRGAVQVGPFEHTGRRRCLSAVSSLRIG